MEKLGLLTAENLDAGMDLLPAKLDSDRARVMVLAIGLQESRLMERRQLPRKKGGPWGPANGLFQFERGGGVRGVLRHVASRPLAVPACRARHVDPTPAAVHLALAHDDVLAVAFARLLLWTDAAPLPELGDEDGSWAMYLRTWRPGSPHPETWPELYRQALAYVTGATRG
jgi:hypothetical protein